jgi:hypothetical protein
MSEFSLPYVGFADGASRSTQNLASAAWAIYAPTNELISLRGVCLGRATNNIAEYSVVIELLVDAISLGIGWTWEPPVSLKLVHRNSLTEEGYY